MIQRKIYVASSWRNILQPYVVTALRDSGHLVYDFRNPCEGDKGFAWSDIDSNWKKWNCKEFIEKLNHPIAHSGYSKDWNAMVWADTVVMVLPCGKSAHIETGYFVGSEKRSVIFMPEPQEPELMYHMVTRIVTTIPEVVEAVR